MTRTVMLLAVSMLAVARAWPAETAQSIAVRPATLESATPPAR